MKDASTSNRSDIGLSSLRLRLSRLRHNSLGTWAVIGLLLALLIGSGVIGYLGWTSTDNSVPTSGYVAMALGVIFSLGVGVGLMALLFYSSRKGYDEPVVFVSEPDPDRDEGQGTSQKGT